MNSSNLSAHVKSVINQEVFKTFGGSLAENIKEGVITNFCCVRLSYALMKCGHKITQKSDYQDKNGNNYIIRCKTMETYLNSNFGQGKVIKSLNGCSGIIHFDGLGFGDATGHFDVVVNGQVAHKSYEGQAQRMVIWAC